MYLIHKNSSRYYENQAGVNYNVLRDFGDAEFPMGRRAKAQIHNGGGGVPFDTG